MGVLKDGGEGSRGDMRGRKGGTKGIVIFFHYFINFIV